MSEHTFIQQLQDSPLHGVVLATRAYAGELTIEVAPENLFNFLLMLKEQYGFTYLADISASDYYTDEKRFEVAYNIANLSARQRLRVVTRVEEEQPEVDSVVAIWDAANWNEREAFDMMGIRFRNHPDLRRMFLPEDFAYYPLRKEFPLLGIPGSLEMPEKAARTF